MGRSLKVAPQHINTVKLALKRQGFPSQTALREEVGLARSTVSNFLNGKPIDRLNFIELCEKLALDWQDIADKEVDTASQTPPTPFHPFQPSTYNAETWVEREKPLAEATEHLRGNCRILLITGITGQGKTALAERVAVTLQREWQPLPGVNLDDETARNFEVAAEQLLVQMGETVQAEDRKQPQFLLNRLVKRLQENPYLVQIDSLEVLLEGKTDFSVQNEFREEHRHWWLFCQRLLLGSPCQSRLILTSQDLPTQFESDKSRFWQKLPLSGLNKTEQMQLFEKLLEKPLPEVSLEAREYLKRMGNAYEGHPLVIEVIAREIATDFAGDVAGYWQQYCREFEEIEAAPGTQKLQRRVKARVRQSLERLQQDSEAAFGLLLAASVYRRKVPESFWLVMVEGDDGDNLLEMLKLRGLTIREYNPKLREFFLRQHNLIQNTAGEWLRKKMPERWKEAHRMAVTVWLNQYQPEVDAENLEKVRGYLEAFHHCCQVEDWETAKEILTTEIPMGEDLNSCLQTWGYYHQRIELLSKLVGKLDDRDWDGICFNGMGIAYFHLGDYQKAIDFHHQHLAIDGEMGDRDGSALVNLGIAYQFLGEYEKAIDFCQQSLNIAREIGDLDGEGRALGSLGNTYDCLGEYEKAIDAHQQHLAITREIGDRHGEGIALGNLGIAYDFLGEYERAIDFHQQHLAIAREIGNRHGEGMALGNLGNIYDSLGDYEKAIEFLQQSLNIAREIGNRYGEGMALGSLGIAYDCLEDYEKAIDFHQQSLNIAREIGNRHGEGMALGSLGNIYDSLGDYEKAINFLQQSLNIAQEIGNYREKGTALANLGGSQFELEQYTEALENTQRALEIFSKICHRYNEAICLIQFSEIHKKLGKIDTALEYCDRALKIATELGIPLAQEYQDLKELLLNPTS